MGCEPDDWAKEWLLNERKNGKKGLTIERRGGMHIVKWATTHWDPVEKKRHKESKYLGVLTEDGNIRDPRARRPTAEVARILDSGNARLLSKMSESFIEDLKFAFPHDYPEIIELAFARCLGRGELNKAGRCWNRLEDVMGLRPNTSPKSLSKTLENIGSARGSQDLFFDRVYREDGEMAIDMSVIFSKARGAAMLKKGYNRFNLSCPQFNLLMGCGLASGRPQYMKVLSGNTKEGSAVSMLDEFSIPEGTVLVMDRGYSDRKFLACVREKGLEYIVAAKRNSKAYDAVDTKEGTFRWNNSAVNYGHAEYEGHWAYRFENLSHRNDELVDSLKAIEKGGTRGLNEEKAGNFLIFSSQELDAKEVYRIYKTRCKVEDIFDTAKNVLSADKMHMHDDVHVMGHLFITFVSAMIRFEIARLIDAADLSSTCTPEDVLDTYACMKVLESDAEMRQTVPKDLRELDAKLGLFMYSSRADLDKVSGVKHKRGRKPKSAQSE